MNKIKSLLLTVALCAGLFSGTVFTGCGTPTQTAIKTETVVITSVDTGMKVWADYVKAGHATQAQVDTVKKSYNAYYDAQQVAKAAILKAITSGTSNKEDIDIANKSVSSAYASLVNLLNTYLNTKI